MVSVGGPASATDPTPLWVRHVQNYPGGISNGPRAYASGDLAAALAKAPATPAGAPRSSPPDAGGNLQINKDSIPPLPQDETTVAYSLDDPLNAVAAANDYVNGGIMVMRTFDGGRHWGADYIVPQFFPTRAPCTGSDPWVDYSRRDKAFYLVTMCFFRAQPESEVHVFKSVNRGVSWTPSRLAAVADTNVDSTGTADASTFNDNTQLVVDNVPSSPHYGRIYVTHVKFHTRDASGFVDFCPAQLAYTDRIPTDDPATAVWQHTPIVPDQPGGPGRGQSANQWPRPQVDKDGNLDIAYTLEDCNSGIDRHLMFQKSTDGGQSFLAHPVQVDKPGQFKDNPDLGDVLAPTAFRAPNSPSLDANKKTGTLTLVYQNNLNRAVSKADISYQQSRDGGRNWTDMRYLSVAAAGAPAAQDQFFPSVDSDQAGNLFAIWFDRRLDPRNHDINTFQAESHDGGRTWSANHRISTASWDPDKSFFTSGAFIGDYNGIAASNQAVYPVWTDGRNSAFDRTGIGETDIFTDIELR